MNINSIEKSLLELIRNEKGGENFDLLGHRDAEAYTASLAANAEIITYATQGQIKAVIAFYCNDRVTLTSFISMVIVSKELRGQGVGFSLVSSVLAMSLERKYERCCLEVNRHNRAAIRLYERLGFSVMQTSEDTLRMEARLR